MTAVVGPLRPVRFNSRIEYHDLPRNTLDIRFEACASHHLACDCREAGLAEDIGEYRMMLRDVEQAVIAATEGHQVWGYDGAGWEDEMSACKCAVCKIRRDCFIGYGEFVAARREADARVAAQRARVGRARGLPAFTPGHPDYVEEVPF